MITFPSTDQQLTVDQLVALRREKLLAEGRHDAFIFALECQGNRVRLHTEIQNSEELIAHGADDPRGPMAPNASPRVYQDGYLAGLKDALRIIEQAERSPQPDAVPEPARVPAFAIAEQRSAYDTTSESAPPTIVQTDERTASRD